MKTIAQQLVEAGLSQLQANVYVALLQMNEASAAELSKRSKVNRVTCYTILSELEAAQLVTTDDTQAVRMFIPMPVENLERWFMRQAKSAIQSFRSVQALVPDLRALSGQTLYPPKIHYIEGKKATNQYIDSVTEHCQSWRMYISRESDYEVVRPLAKHAADQDYRPKTIIPRTLKAGLLIYLDHRTIASSIRLFPSTMLICNDRVLSLFTKDEMLQLFIIEDERIALQNCLIFDSLWDRISGIHSIPVREG